MLYYLLFIAGFGSALTPGIIPLLPMVFAKNDKGKKQHATGLFLGFMISFIPITALLVAVVEVIGLSEITLRYIALGFIAFFGLIMISQFLYTNCTRIVEKIANLGLAIYSKQASFSEVLNGLIAGIVLGLVWTPFAGPLLTALITLSAHPIISWHALAIIGSFSLGTSTALFIYASYLKKYASFSPRFAKYKVPLLRACGLVVFFTAFFCMLSPKPTRFERYLIERAR